MGLVGISVLLVKSVLIVLYFWLNVFCRLVMWMLLWWMMVSGMVLSFRLFVGLNGVLGKVFMCLGFYGLGV